MKIKDTFQLVTVAGEHMVIPIGEQSVDFQAMITLNETGAFLWEKLQEEMSEERKRIVSGCPQNILPESHC